MKKLKCLYPSVTSGIFCQAMSQCGLASLSSYSKVVVYFHSHLSFPGKRRGARDKVSLLPLCGLFFGFVQLRLADFRFSLKF